MLAAMADPVEAYMLMHAKSIEDTDYMTTNVAKYLLHYRAEAAKKDVEIVAVVPSEAGAAADTEYYERMRALKKKAAAPVASGPVTESAVTEMAAVVMSFFLEVRPGSGCVMS